jgi:hypothetical protein
VVGWQHDDDLLVQQIDELESLHIERPAQKRHVERPGSEASDRLDGVLAMKNQPQVREMRGHERTQRWQDPNIGGGKRPHRQVAGASSGCLLG